MASTDTQHLPKSTSHEVTQTLSGVGNGHIQSYVNRLKGTIIATNWGTVTSWCSYISPRNMFKAFWPITWRHPAMTIPVSSSFAMALESIFAAFQRVEPHFPVTSLLD